MIIGGCGGTPHEPSALEMAEAVFVGSYSQEQIKTGLDQALSLWRLEVNETNYLKYASVLVRLRKDTGVPEMSILDYTIRSHVPSVKTELHEVMAIACTVLQAGDE